MFSKSSGLVFLAISLCVQAIPCLEPHNTATQAGPATSPTVRAASPTATKSSGNNNGDPQTSLTLDPRVIAKGFASNGQQTAESGQVPSLTSTNNYINFCLTNTDLPITNGKQVTTGSCNPAPMGYIPAADKIPSAKFTSPSNFDTIPANKNFTVEMAIQNLQTGNFVNPDSNYFSAPQQLNSQGTIIGHSHIVIELLTSLQQKTPSDPKIFAFFSGLNAAASNGILSTTVAKGLPPGVYKMSSINTAANHQPVLAPIAQHGSLDDAIYFTVSDGGAAGNGGKSKTGASAPKASTTPSPGNSPPPTPSIPTSATSVAC